MSGYICLCACSHVNQIESTHQRASAVQLALDQIHTAMEALASTPGLFTIHLIYILQLCESVHVCWDSHMRSGALTQAL